MTWLQSGQSANTGGSGGGASGRGFFGDRGFGGPGFGRGRSGIGASILHGTRLSWLRGACRKSGLLEMSG